jgi:hypothetical protein
VEGTLKEMQGKSEEKKSRVRPNLLERPAKKLLISQSSSCNYKYRRNKLSKGQRLKWRLERFPMPLLMAAKRIPLVHT